MKLKLACKILSALQVASVVFSFCLFCLLFLYADLNSKQALTCLLATALFVAVLGAFKKCLRHDGWSTAAQEDLEQEVQEEDWVEREEEQVTRRNEQLSRTSNP